MEEKPFSKGEEAVYKIYAVVKKNENPALKDDECRSLFKEEVLDLKNTNEQNKKIREIACLYNEYKKVNTSPDKQTDSKATQCNDESKEIPTGISTEEMFEMSSQILPIPFGSEANEQYPMIQLDGQINGIFASMLIDLVGALNERELVKTAYKDAKEDIYNYLPIFQAYLIQFKKNFEVQVSTKEKLTKKLEECKSNQGHEEVYLQKIKDLIDDIINKYNKLVEVNDKKNIKNINMDIETEKEYTDGTKKVTGDIFSTDNNTNDDKIKSLIIEKEKLIKLEEHLTVVLMSFSISLMNATNDIKNTFKIDGIQPPQAILGGRKSDEDGPIMSVVANIDKQMLELHEKITQIDKELIELYNSEYQKK